MANIDSRAAGSAAGMGKVRLAPDISCGHPPCFPPTRPATGSLTVFTDQFPNVRVTDLYIIHCCGPACHVPVAVIGSVSVFSDQLMQHRRTDGLSCGDMACTGSITCFSGMPGI